MAIKIPSKNIYNIDNPKVRDNVIDDVLVEQTVVKPNNEYEVSVYNQTFYDFSLEKVDKTKAHFKTDLKAVPNSNSYGGVDYFSACSYVEYNSYKKSSFTLYFPLIENNRYIKRIYTGKDENGEPEIKYSLYGDLYEGVASSVFKSSQGDVFDVYPQPISYGEPKISHNSILIIPNELFHQKDMTYGTFDPKTSLAKAEVAFGNEGTIYSPKVEIVETDKEYYKVEIDFYSSVQTVVMEGEYLEIYDRGKNRPNVSMVGEYKTYIPNEIEITINGDTLGISLEDGSVTYIKDQNGNIAEGSGNKPHSLDRNELLQDSGKVKTIDESGNEVEKPITEHLANNVLKQYERGKETATLLCSISDYYDENGIKRINSLTKKSNLLPAKYLFGSTATQFNIVVTSQEDGGIRIQGSNTSGGMIFFNLSNEDFGNNDMICKDGEMHITIGDYTISMRGENLSNVWLGYNKHNTTTWLAITDGATVDTIVYPMVNKGGLIPYEPSNSSMSFRLHDEVIPMIYGADRQDKPMSKYQDGTPKVFEVISSNIIYDGAMWQELVLLEKTK